LSTCAAWVPAAASAAPPAIYNLGTLSGSSFGLAVNASGQVAGWSDIIIDKEAPKHAFLYTGGVMADLGTLGGESSAGYAINSSGQVAGTAGLPPAPDFSETIHAFLFSGTPGGGGGAMADLGSLGGDWSEGYAINGSGQVAGYSAGENFSRHAFLYSGTPGSGGTMADLGTLPGSSDSVAQGLNASGQVVGYSWTPSTTSTRAFLYTGTPGHGGKMVGLGSLSGTRSAAFAINDAGQIVGWSSTASDSVDHAFLYQSTPGKGSEMIDLGTLPGATSSQARAINSWGQIQQP